MKKQEKKWETPKLICLYRGRPEEAVLQSCKTAVGGVISGPNQQNKCGGTSGVCSDVGGTS